MPSSGDVGRILEHPRRPLRLGPSKGFWPGVSLAFFLISLSLSLLFIYLFIYFFKFCLLRGNYHLFLKGDEKGGENEREGAFIHLLSLYGRVDFCEDSCKILQDFGIDFSFFCWIFSD